MGRTVGAKNKLKRDVASMLKLNSLALLDRAIKISLEDPEKYNATLNKLLDKITPNLNVTTTINVTKDFEDRLSLIQKRADELIQPKMIEIEVKDVAEPIVEPEKVEIPDKPKSIRVQKRDLSNGLSEIYG